MQAKGDGEDLVERARGADSDEEADVMAMVAAVRSRDEALEDEIRAVGSRAQVGACCVCGKDCGCLGGGAHACARVWCSMQEREGACGCWG